MAILGAPYWNRMTTNVAERIATTIFDLVDKMEGAGYPPFTEPPEPDIRYILYMQRPADEWLFIAQRDPERALDEVRDFANMARRRGESEVAEAAARAVLSQFAVEDSYARPA